MTVRFRGRPKRAERGMSLLELIIVCAILLVLASAAMPMARFTVKRQKEAELRRDLREMRDSIDRYKDTADRNLIRVEVGTEGYPPDLDTLVKGVDLVAQATAAIGGATVPGTPAGATGFGGIGGLGGASGMGGLGAAAGAAGSTGIVVSGQSGSAATPFGSASISTPASGGDLIRHVRFLRKIPVDPMTGRAEWGLRAVSDDPDSSSWGGKDVFDVFSLSTGTALDGTKYSEW